MGCAIEAGSHRPIITAMFIQTETTSHDHVLRFLPGCSVVDGEAMTFGDEAAARDRTLGDLRALQGVSKFPVRIKCALLGFDALQEALKQSRLEAGAQ